MVKGISRQVILVNSPDQELFEQAIFILKDDRQEVSNDGLLREAYSLFNKASGKGKRPFRCCGPLWACCGALLVGVIWLLVSLF